MLGSLMVSFSRVFQNEMSSLQDERGEKKAAQNQRAGLASVV